MSGVTGLPSETTNLRARRPASSCWLRAAHTASVVPRRRVCTASRLPKTQQRPATCRTTSPSPRSLDRGLGAARRVRQDPAVVPPEHFVGLEPLPRGAQRHRQPVQREAVQQVRHPGELLRVRPELRVPEGQVGELLPMIPDEQPDIRDHHGEVTVHPHPQPSIHPLPTGHAAVTLNCSRYRRRTFPKKTRQPSVR